MPIATPDDLRQWLAGLRQEHLTDPFIAGGWLGERLPTLTREDLADLGVPKDQHGDLMLAVEALRQGEGPVTLPDERAPSYAPQFTPAVVAACRTLGREPPRPWVDAVADAWPGPIAHEYHRLRELLADGHIVPAIFQLKDLVEVSIKFPALVMARDLLQHGDADAGMAARRALFGGMLSLGHWLERARDALAPHVRRLAPHGRLLCPELGSLFVETKPSGKVAPTPWSRTLGSLVTWRNDQLGHGAFRLDPGEYLAELRDHLDAINAALAEQRDLWRGVVLRGAGPDGPDLTGWRAIRHWHTGGAGEHREQQSPVLLERAGRTLDLAPLVALRRCAVCGQQDVFLYDSMAGYSLDQGFKLLDYLTGHRLALPPHRAGELLAEVHESPPLPAAGAGELGEDYGDVALNELLEAKLLEARYLRPEYLREPLRRFVAARPRGVFWLTAPAHTGKSVFVHGLAAPQEVSEKPLLEATAVVALHIRREFKTWPEQLRFFLLEHVLRRTFGREPGRLRLPELDVQAERPADAFAALLHATMRLKPPHLERLVIGLDGLDELPPSPSGEAGIADFLPRPEALPDGCFLLLTSRPPAECPSHVNTALAGRFDGCADFAAFALTLEVDGAAADAPGAAYRQLLRAYFDRELSQRLRSALSQALAAFIAGRDAVDARNDLGRLPPALAAFAKQEWAELTRAVRVRSPASAPSLIETVAQPVLVRFDAAFAAALDKANARFLYLAHLTELLRDGRLRFEDLAALPTGVGLYRHFLTQLEQRLAAPGAESDGGLASKPWDFARRVILTLAAVEQAHVAYQQILPLGVREEVFQGVPLDVLEALLDEPRRGVRLVFALYTLKSILAVWKGEDARDARYALGLKDFAATVQALWPEALADRHRFLAGQMLEALDGRWETVTDADRLDAWRLRYVLAHADLGGDPEQEQCLIDKDKIENAFTRLGSQARKCAHNTVAMAYWSLSLILAERRFHRWKTIECCNTFAKAHLNRGLALSEIGDLAGAMIDYIKGIFLMENLRELLETNGEWPSEFVGDLANMYQSKGILLYNNGDLEGAIRDFGYAIALWEALLKRQLINGWWLLDWTNDWAAGLMNRGAAHHSRENWASAITDFDTAISLMEALRESLESRKEGWPVAYANALANAYLNRGVTHRTCGNLVSTMEDYNRAISLMEALREKLKPLEPEGKWPLVWANDLAMAYMNRGNARNGGDGREGADYDRAIKLREVLRNRLEPRGEWRPAWANDLAMVYMNRGKMCHNSGDLDGALADYDRAIQLMEALRDRLEPKGAWLPAWAKGLAEAYGDRGNARADGGDRAGATADYHRAIDSYSAPR